MMIKKCLALILVLVAVLGVSPVVMAEEKPDMILYEGIKREIDNIGKYHKMYLTNFQGEWKACLGLRDESVKDFKNYFEMWLKTAFRSEEHMRLQWSWLHIFTEVL